ncbi:MAG: helix-turn-helix domain-containing protein, partial [bacterium]|nr:helix-turn-helix domain-containing protein [bacterium]
IYSFLEDTESNLWVGTYSGGLVRLTNARVTALSRENGLPNSLVRTLSEDANGYLWLGTDRQGITTFKSVNTPQLFEPASPFTTVNLKEHKVTTLFHDKNNHTWLGTRKKGAIHIVNGIAKVYSQKEGLSSNKINVIFGDNAGRIWIGTKKGLNRLDPAEPGTTRKMIPGVIPGAAKYIKTEIRSITEDTSHTLWVGTTKGLFVVKNGQYREFRTSAGKPFLHDILSLYCDKNNTLWIGTNGSGLGRLQNGELKTCTSDGGLHSNYIFSILEDQSGNLWMSSYSGVFRVSKKELIAFTGNIATPVSSLSFDERDGMRSRECVAGGHPSACQTSTGKLCFPTLKGIAVFDPPSIRVNRKPPQMIIEKILADNKPLEKEGNNNISGKVMEFYFTAISLTAPGKIKIRYKLEGFDKNWREVDTPGKQSALYVNLEAGDYCFNVIACNNDGLWSTQPAAYRFEIKSLFSTIPYYLIPALLLGALLTVLYRTLYANKKNAAESPSTTGTGKKTVEMAVKKTKNSSEKYKTSALSPETVSDILPKLTHLMEKEKAFLDADLTLKKLAQKLNVHYNHLSQIINDRLQQSFNDYINSFRIEEAKKKLADPAESKQTVLEIAYNTGFYSKSVFNTAFKKFTGITPSQYRKEERGKK